MILSSSGISQTASNPIVSYESVLYVFSKQFKFILSSALQYYFPAPGDLNLVNTVEFQSVLSETKAYSHYSQAYADNITAESIENISSEAKNTDNLVWDEKYYIPRIFPLKTKQIKLKRFLIMN